MIKRLFVIGASILQVPAIKKAKEMGLYVGVADFNPKAVGIPLADEYFSVSTIDEKGVYEAAKEFKADGIVTVATDMPMRSVAYASAKLGLVGISYDTAIKATDKGEMAKAFKQHNVPHPDFEIVEAQNIGEFTLSRDISYPLITKPTDNSGSRGVMLVNNKRELLPALKYSSSCGRSGSVIVEEYMKGPEVSVEIMAVDGKVHILQITDKLTTGAPHFVEMGHSQPSCLDIETIEKIKSVAVSAANAIGLLNGPAHAEIIITKDGPKMVEIGARMGGDFITTHLVPLSTGIDMVKATISVALGEKPDICPKFEKGSAIKYFDVQKGIIKEISGISEANKIEGVKEITFTKTIGDEITEIGNSNDRAGFVIADGKDAKEALKNCEKAVKLTQIIVE